MPIKISFKKNIIESKIKNYILFTNENFKIIGLEKTSLSKQSNTINKTINNSKQPIIIFGGNWCGDCRVLAGTFNLPTIKKFLDKHYEVLHIDVGRYEINMNLMEYFNIPREEGVPRVLVFDKNNNLLNSSSTKEWTTARDRKQQDIFNYFQNLITE